jgi:hypothetical protein
LSLRLAIAMVIRLAPVKYVPADAHGCPQPRPPIAINTLR